jgi:hypothetical protein
MRELSLHILDMVENAIEANAAHVDLQITEDMDADLLQITVIDDGAGMDADAVQRARDPFYTTRKTRHVGLGIPLFAAAAERCGGAVAIASTPGEGTTIEAQFRHSHIDRAPLGDLPGTLVCILMNERTIDLRFRHTCVVRETANTFELDTIQIKQVLGDVPLTHPAVRDWLRAHIADGEAQLKEA